jgi:hypothetical protein
MREAYRAGRWHYAGQRKWICACRGLMTYGAVMRTVLLGGLVVGVIDMLDAFAFSYLRGGVAPTRVLQAIASGLIGRSAFDGGTTTAVLGLAIHFCIATTVAAAYVVASRRFRVLIDHAVIAGLVYGVGVYGVMQYVVLPMSAFRMGPFNWAGLANGLVIHAFGVGLPVALIARRFGDSS